jgi:hypothetical protein
MMNKRKVPEDHLPSAAALAAALALDRNFPSGPVTDAIAAAASAVAAAAATGADTLTVSMPSTAHRRRRTADIHHDFNGEVLGGPPKKYACDGCDATFSAQSHLITHHRMHTGEKPYVCEDCSLAFAQKNNLIRHRRGTSL